MRRSPRRLGPWSWASLCLLLGGALACGTAKPPTVDFAPAARSYRSEDYPTVYRRWTRHEKIVRETEPALEVWATFKTFDYRQAFVAHYAEAYVLSPPDREQLLQGQREAAEEQYEFLMTAQSANYRWNDLEKKNSPWRLTLVDGAGHALIPDEVKVEKLPEMFEREFFPVRTPFTKTYVVRFPRSKKSDDFVGEASGMMMLRIAGPLGHAELVWSARGGERAD